ncbi:hypothetical protein [Mammaliicoccus sp. H-M32]|nr:hypothetical protein [Mammaliicoccus sp. H-M32]
MTTNNDDLLKVVDDLFDQKRKQNEFWNQLYADISRCTFLYVFL